MTRAQTERQERRRRNGVASEGRPQRLAIPPEVEERLRAEGRTARWVTDEGARMHNLTVRDDYDVVEGVDPVKTVTQDGKVFEMRLVAKPAEFIAEDRAAADSRRREAEAKAMAGDVPSEGASINTQEGALSETYTPAGNSIARKRGL